MDPATAMNAAPPFNLSEIWPLPDGMFGPGLGRFVEPAGPAQQASGTGDGGRGGGRGSGARKRRENSVDDDNEDGQGSVKGVCNGNMSDSDGKRLKTSGSGDDNQNQKGDDEASPKAEQKTKAPPEPPKDYIHVRARRGQATDSHSLAERARREKISERMRILQDLVPGCNKVIGKALVLDEIINYIQSLQRQVEFLSMKLEAVNSRSPPGIEGFPSKDFGQQAFDAVGVVYGSQPSRDYGRGSSPEWLHMQVGGSFERQT